MTVAEVTARNDYVGDNSLKVFAYTFRIIVDAAIEVLLDSVTATLGTDYSVTGAGDLGGGTIVFVTAPGTSVKVAFLRLQAHAQGSNYVPNEDFPSERLEADLDKVTMQIQMLREEMNRILKVGKGVTATNLEFPDPTLAANRLKFLRINAAGTGFEAVAASSLPIEDGSVITAEGALVQGGSGGAPEEFPRSARGDLIAQGATKFVVIAVGANKKYVKSNGTDPVYDDIIALKESGGQVLDITTITDGQFVKRVGTDLSSADPEDLVARALAFLT